MRSKFTEPVRRKAIATVADGGTLAEAAKVAGLAERTLKDWIRRGNRGESEELAEFAQAVSEARSSCGEPGDEEELLRLLWRSARRGSLRAIELLLKRIEEGEPAGHKSQTQNDKAGGQAQGGKQLDALDALSQLDELAARRVRSA